MTHAGFRCAGCGFRCENPAHVHHECLTTDRNVVVAPHDHEHEGCWRNPWRSLLALLEDVPLKALLAGSTYGHTSDTHQRCQCFYGAVLPKGEGPVSQSHEARVRREPWYLAWLKGLGFEGVPDFSEVGFAKDSSHPPPEGAYVEDKTYFPMSFRDTYVELRHLEWLNDSMTGPNGPGRNDEASCRARYDFMHKALTTRAADWDAARKGKSDVP